MARSTRKRKKSPKPISEFKKMIKQLDVNLNEFKGLHSGLCGSITSLRVFLDANRLTISEEAYIHAEAELTEVRQVCDNALSRCENAKACFEKKELGDYDANYQFITEAMALNSLTERLLGLEKYLSDAIRKKEEEGETA